MSTSSIVSAARTTASGTVSRCRIPVIEATTSLRDSRCWMFTVVITSMPGRQQGLDVLPALGVTRRLARGSPALVWASSSTRATSGRRASTAARSSSPTSSPAVVDLSTRQHLQVADRGLGLRPAVRLDEGRPPRRCPVRRAAGPRRASRTSSRPRGRSEVDPQRTALHGLSLHRPLRVPAVPVSRRPCGSAINACCRARFSSTTFTRGSPEEAQRRVRVMCSLDQLAYAVGGQAARPRDPVDLQERVRRVR